MTTPRRSFLASLSRQPSAYVALIATGMLAFIGVKVEEGFKANKPIALNAAGPPPPGAHSISPKIDIYQPK